MSKTTTAKASLTNVTNFLAIQATKDVVRAKFPSITNLSAEIKEKNLVVTFDEDERISKKDVEEYLESLS